MERYGAKRLEQREGGGDRRWGVEREGGGREREGERERGYIQQKTRAERELWNWVVKVRSGGKETDEQADRLR